MGVENPWPVSPFDNGDCPVQCNCSSSEECSDILPTATTTSASVDGAFCTTHPISAHDSTSNSMCLSCQILQDYGIFTPDGVGSAENVSMNDDDGGGADPNSRSELCPPNTPCLCATSSDCPTNHYCATELSGFEDVHSSLMMPIHTHTSDACWGFCVSCTLGCRDNQVLNTVADETNSILPHFCYDVCPYHLQCNTTHEECEQYKTINLNDTGAVNISETYWCSENHMCNVCSLGCAMGTTDSEDNSFVPSIDGGCPSGCCGWGVSREPYWNPSTRSIVAPCGATSETPILPMFVPYASSYSSLPAEIFVAIGQMCSGVEMEYQESGTVSSASLSPLTEEEDEDQPTIGNATSTRSIARKALEVDCIDYQSYFCDAFPISFAIITRPNTSSSNYSFIVEPIMINDGDYGYYCTPVPTSWQTKTTTSFSFFSRQGAIMMFIGGIMGIVLLRMGVCKPTRPPTDGQNHQNDNPGDNGNRTAAVAIPASIFDSMFPPPPLPHSQQVSTNTIEGSSVSPPSGASFSIPKVEKSSASGTDIHYGVVHLPTSLPHLPEQAPAPQSTVEISSISDPIIEIDSDEEV
jgi:hypothetical protein